MTELEALDIAIKAVDLYAVRHPRPPHVNITQAAKMLDVSYPTARRILDRHGVGIDACGLIPIEKIDRLLMSLTGR